jgi:hypothetical protein
LKDEASGAGRFYQGSFGTGEVAAYGALKLLPFWDPLRGDPRFEKIVASLAPKESAAK